jgi:hypothetical protein
MNFNRIREKFAIRGIRADRPADLLPKQSYLRATNIRSYVDGRIEQRKGMTLLYDVDTGASEAVHSIKQLNDPVNSRATYFTGAGTKLYADNSAHSAATEIDSGYSGDPLAMVVHRPDQSPLPFLYVADRSRMRKAKSTAAGDTFKSFPIGISPPLVPPTVSLDGPLVKVVSEFDATAGWTQGGDAGAPALLAGKRVDTTITYILYDTGTTGFACVNPATLSAQLQAGMRLVVNAAGTPETVTVEDVYPAITSTTISSIQYDSGTSGPCTIVLTAPSAALRKDSMLRIAAAENVRVLSVTAGPQGVTSFRCSTTATRAAGDAVAGLASFRANFTANHAATETLTDEAVETTVTFSTGIGTLALTGALDLSVSSTRPFTNDDHMVAGVRVDRPDRITEIKFQLDVADATNDFTKDFYTKSFRAADLTAAVRNTTATLTTEQRAIQREQIDQNRFGGLPTIDSRGFTAEPDIGNFRNFIPVPEVPSPDDPAGGTQLGLGDSVWTTLTWKLSDMERVGQDMSRNLKNVAAIRVVVVCTGTVVVDLDSWYVRGGYGLDVQGAYWAYRYRSLETKARSLLSPPTRSPLDVTRGSVTVNCTTKDTTTSGDPQVTAIDIYRFDDVLEDWSLVGTVANPANSSATTANFTDEFSDEFVKDNPLAEWDQFQPWPVPDLPRSGTCDVKGTEVTRLTGDNFNTSWARGSRFKINGTPCTLYTSPTSTSRLSLNENLGTLSNVKWESAEPLLLGQPRAVLFGPYGAGSVGIFFFSVDGGALIWTNPNNPDAASDRNRLEITSPSEPLLNGYIYDGRPFVCSAQRKFGIFPSQLSDGTFTFVAQEVANTEGLYAQWALAVDEGGLIYTVGKDGIYESEGGEDRLISGDLGPLFPHDGLGGADGQYVAPDFSHPEALRLSCVDDRVRFVYSVTAKSIYRCFVWNRNLRCWESNDLYSPNAVCFYTQEGSGVHGELIGGKDGKLYQTSTLGTDAGTAISKELRIGAQDAGDNNLKFFHDLTFDLDTAQNDVSIAIATESYQFSQPPSPSILNTASRDQVIVDISAGLGANARNIGFTLSWTVTDVYLYEYVLTFIPRPASAKTWRIPAFTYNYPDFFFVKELWLAHAANANIVVKVFIDGVETNPTGGYVVTNNAGEFAKTRVILQAAKGKAVEFRFVTDVSSQLFMEDSEIVARGWGGDYQNHRLILEPQLVGGGQ